MFSQAYILSINTDGMMARLLQLGETIAQKQPLAVLIQDPPKTKDNGLYRIITRIAPKYNLLHYSNESNTTSTIEQSDTAILVHTEKVEIKTIHRLPKELQNRGATAIGASINIVNGNLNTTNSTQPKLIIFSIYLRPRTHFTDVNNCLEWVEQVCRNNEGLSRTIIAGDLNAVNPLWAPINEITDNKETSEKHYSLIKETRGRHIERATNRMGLKCLNNVKLGPTYTMGTRSSHIDVAFVGVKALRQWNKMALSELARGKGHKLLILRSCFKVAEQPSQRKTNRVRTFKKIHTELISPEHFLHTNIQAWELLCNWHYLPVERIHRRADQLTNILYQGLIQTQEKITTIHIKPKQRRFQLGAANPRTRNHLQKLEHAENYLAELRRMLRVDRRKGNAQTTRLLKKKTARATLKRDRLRTTMVSNMERAQLAHHHKEESPDNSENRLWRSVRQAEQLFSHTERTSEEIDESTLKTQQDINKLAETKFPTRIRAKERFTKTAIEEREPYSIKIDDREIDEAIKTLRKKKYNTPEGINMRVFYKSIQHVKEIVYTIARMSFETAYIPQSCRITLGTLIPKKKQNEFRIVHVSSPMASLLELIALKRLEYKLEIRRLNSPYQFGFCAMRSRHDLIARVLELALKHRYSAQRNTSTIIISLDIKGAFDNVNQDMLIAKMDMEMGRDPLKYWLAEFILNRRIKIKKGQLVSEIKQVCTGVPQGSALGPILWNYAISNIEKGITVAGHTELLKYADDILIVHSSTHRRIEDDPTPQKCLDELESKLQALELALCPEKSSYMQVTRMQHTNNNCNLKVSGLPIERTDHLKILGIAINKQLKLELEEKSSKENLVNATTKLFNIRQLEIINTADEWRTLIDSLINSRLIINNWPLLTFDMATNKQIDNLFANTIKTIFAWPRNCSNKLIKLITGNLASRTTAIKMAQLKRHSDMGAAYEYLFQLSDPSESTIIKTTPSHRANQISNLEQNARFYKRKHFNPDKMLKTFQEEDLEELMNRVGPIWTILERKNGSLMAELIFDQVLQVRLARHSDYPIPYFNSFAILLKMAQDRSTSHRSLVLHSENSLLKALENYSNHDWRLINLRETLHDNGWRIYKVNKELHLGINSHMNNLYTTLATKPTATPEDINSWMVLMEPATDTSESATPHESTNQAKLEHIKQPPLGDYKDRNYLRSRYRIYEQQEHTANHTRLTQSLCQDTKVWQDITPNWLDGQKMIMLSGLITTEDKQLIRDEGTEASIICECRRQDWNMDNPTWLDTQPTIIDKYTALHRAFRCNKFEAARRTAIEKINRALGNQQELATGIKAVLTHKRASQTFLRHLARSAMNIKD